MRELVELESFVVNWWHDSKCGLGPLESLFRLLDITLGKQSFKRREVERIKFRESLFNRTEWDIHANKRMSGLVGISSVTLCSVASTGFVLSHISP